MPIDSDFPKNHQTIGKHKHAGGEHFHFIWGTGRSDAETSTKSEVQEAYKVRGAPVNWMLLHLTITTCEID